MKKAAVGILISCLLFGAKSLLASPSLSPPEEYSINLQWINKSLDPQQRYIFPAQTADELNTKLLNPLFQWAELHPTGVTINLWIDGKASTPSAINLTQELIDKRKAATTQKLSPIVIRDIHTLDLVKENPDVFASPIPTYFRVDLSRVIAAYEDLMNGKTPWFIFANLNMPPIDQKELFDERTLGYMNRFGIVMREKNSGILLENSFFIMGGSNKSLMSATKLALIDLNIGRGKLAIQEGGYYRPALGTCMSNLEQMVYNSYEYMFTYFYALEGYAQLRQFKGYSRWSEVLSLANINIEHFNLDQRAMTINLILEINDRGKGIILDCENNRLFPTKPLSMPVAKLKYHDSQFNGNKPKGW